MSRSLATVVEPYRPDAGSEPPRFCGLAWDCRPARPTPLGGGLFPCGAGAGQYAASGKAELADAVILGRYGDVPDDLAPYTSERALHDGDSDLI
jgi:hypothetical protein